MRNCRRALLALALVGCNERQVAIEGGADQASSPDWSSCVYDGEFETCEDVCASMAMACVADGCPADPEFCVPNSCEKATQLVGWGEVICTDPSVAGYVSSTCDSPIVWALNNTTRCCCED
jgi:hypothetical protein